MTNRGNKEKNTYCEESEVLKLKRLILIFKKKYQCALLDLAKKEKEMGPEESEEAKKYLEIQEENAALVKQQKALKELLQKTQHELVQIKNKGDQDEEGAESKWEQSLREEKMSAESAFAAVQANMKALENKRCAFENENLILTNRVEKLLAVVKKQERQLSELQRYEYSCQKMGMFNQKLEENCEQLKSSLQQVKKEKEMLVLSLEERSEQLSRLENTCASLQKKDQEAGIARNRVEEQEKELIRMKQQMNLIEDQLRLHEEEKMGLEKSLDKEIQEHQESRQGREELKKALVQAVCEMREVKRRYQQTAAEKAEGLKKIEHIQGQLRENREKLDLKEQEIGSLSKQIDGEKREQEELNKQLAQRQKERMESEQRIRQKDQSILSLSEQIKTLQGQLTNAQQLIQEKEKGILTAQQHLAKKVKEASQLKEGMEEQRKQLVQYQEELGHLQEKIVAFETAIASQREEKEKQEEKMNQWEKRYVQTYGILEECKAENKELKTFRTKFEQLQQLLTKLGDAVETPASFSQTTPAAVEKAPRSASEKPIHKQPPGEQTLFDREKRQEKYKNDLFSRS